MRSMTKTIMALAIPTVLMAGGNAMAAKITSWSYENEFGFSAFTNNFSAGNAGPVAATTFNTQNPNFLTGSQPANPSAGDGTTLQWGIPGSLATNPAQKKSALRLSDSTGITTAGLVTGSVNTDGAFVPDVSVFHDNFALTGNSASLKTATVTASLLLLADPTSTPEVGPLTGIFNILFKETPNNGSNHGGFCADGQPVPASGCPDIFVLDTANSSDLTNVFLGQFADFKYFLDVNIVGLAPLGPQACADANTAAGCVGFITAENATSQVDVLFRIRSEFVPSQVPEPGMLALLGLGLAALGFGQIRRRK